MVVLRVTALVCGSFFKPNLILSTWNVAAFLPVITVILKVVPKVAGEAGVIVQAQMYQQRKKDIKVITA